MNGQPYNWDAVPIVWTKYNEEELPLCYFIKELIDDVNWQTSVIADVLRDIAKFIFILKNYGGQDIDQFTRELYEALAIQMEGTAAWKTGADPHIDAVMAFLDKNRPGICLTTAAVWIPRTRIWAMPAARPSTSGIWTWILTALPLAPSCRGLLSR